MQQQEMLLSEICQRRFNTDTRIHVLLGIHLVRWGARVALLIERSTPSSPSCSASQRCFKVLTLTLNPKPEPCSLKEALPVCSLSCSTSQRCFQCSGPNQNLGGRLVGPSLDDERQCFPCCLCAPGRRTRGTAPVRHGGAGCGGGPQHRRRVLGEAGGGRPQLLRPQRPLPRHRPLHRFAVRRDLRWWAFHAEHQVQAEHQEM